jgi:hypothetical protein
VKLLFEILIVLVAAQGQNASKLPDNFYNALLDGDQVVEGKITAIRIIRSSALEEQGMVELSNLVTLTEKNMPDHLAIEFESSLRSTRRPAFGWTRVRPKVGKRVLVALKGSGSKFYTEAVLDLDSPEAESVPVIKQLIELRSTPPSQAYQKLWPIVGANEGQKSSFARDLLIGTPGSCPFGSECRKKLFEHEKAMALDQNYPERVQMLDNIAADSINGAEPSYPSNYNVLSLLLNLCGDPDKHVRGEAAQLAAGYIASARKLDISKVTLANRREIIDRLRADVASNQYYAPAAKKILEVLSERGE